MLICYLHLQHERSPWHMTPRHHPQSGQLRHSFFGLHERVDVMGKDVLSLQGKAA